MSPMEEALLQSEASAKPFLVRALCEWCSNQAMTPYLVVRVNEATCVPADLVNEDGEIVFNLSERTTHQLSISNQHITFFARFSGVSQEVVIPFSAVAAVFAKETGYGLYFHTSSEQPPEKTETALTKSQQEGKETRSSHLKLV